MAELGITPTRGWEAAWALTEQEYRENWNEFKARWLEGITEQARPEVLVDFMGKVSRKLLQLESWQ